MKRLLASLLLLTLPSLGSFAVDTVFLEPVLPTSPELKAQGGTSTSNAKGYDSLFANPAAFSDPTAEITILSTTLTAHLSLAGMNQILNTRDSWGSFSPTSGGPVIDAINSLLSTSTVGEEVSTGFAWVGGNLGVGMLVQERLTARGPNLLDAKSRVDLTTMGIIGMGWPFDVGAGTLRIGGAIRPMQRTISDIAATDLLKNLFNPGGFSLYSGFGMGIDLGLRWDYAGFQTGLVVRDVSTLLNLQKYSFSKWQAGLGFPTGGDSSGKTLYRIPPVLGIGTTWTPDVGTLSSLFQPKLSLDFQIPFKDEFTQPSFWTWTHVGAEAKLLKAFSLRAGMNQGYLTFGMGFRLFILDFNMAVFADELGRYSGLNRRSGLALQWALKL